MIKKLEDLRAPDVAGPAHQRQLKLMLLSAKKSSRIGILLVAAPLLFMLGIILKYGFSVAVPGFTALEETMSAMDHSFFRFVPPLVLAGGPLVALGLNLLAIMHFQLDREKRELQVALKLRMLNLLIIGACLFILGMLFVHIIAEHGETSRSVH